MTPETLRKWIRQATVDEGQAPEVASEAAEIGELKREVSELERTIEILTAATSFFAREHDPRCQWLERLVAGAGPPRCSSRAAFRNLSGP